MHLARTVVLIAPAKRFWAPRCSCGRRLIEWRPLSLTRPGSRAPVHRPPRRVGRHVSRPGRERGSRARQVGVGAGASRFELIEVVLH